MSVGGRVVTFPASFPFAFGRGGSGIGLPITGWFADLFVGAPVMSVTAVIPAPDVVYQHLVSAPVMAVSMAAPTPSVKWIISAPTMLAPDAMPAPTLVWTIPAPSAAVTASIPAPTLQEVLTVPSASMTAAIPAPTLTQTLSISPPVMTVTAAIPAPTLSQGLSAPVVSVTAAIPAPTPGWAEAPPVMAVTASIPAPAVLINVAYDATGTGNHAILTSSGITNTHTLGANATAILVAVSNFISGDTYASVTSNSCVIGSTPMTLLGVVTDGNTASNGWTEVWGLINPPTGSQTITYKESAGASFPSTIINSVSYSGVASFGTAVTNFGSGLSLTTGSVVSAVGDMVFASISGDGGVHPLVLSGGGTQRYNGSASASINLLIQDIAGAPTDTLTATSTGSAGWGTVAVDLIHL